VIVVDASALADALLSLAAGRQAAALLKGIAAAHTSDLIDAEVASAMRAAERRRLAPPEEVQAALLDLTGFPLVRHPYRPLLGRAWELRRNFNVCDALYVALAEAADMPLLTTDRRLARAVKRHTDVALAA
jgi:predicted nucleic acid-binding protein